MGREPQWNSAPNDELKSGFVHLSHGVFQQLKEAHKAAWHESLQPCLRWSSVTDAVIQAAPKSKEVKEQGRAVIQQQKIGKPGTTFDLHWVNETGANKMLLLMGQTLTAEEVGRLKCRQRTIDYELMINQDHMDFPIRRVMPKEQAG